jgi:hypothetical protein
MAKMTFGGLSGMRLPGLSSTTTSGRPVIPFSCPAALAIRSRTGLSVLVTDCIANIPSSRFSSRPQDWNDLTSAATSQADVRIR